MIRYPNAKINLGLHVTEKRPDGFHNLETVFYPIGLSDILEVVTPNSENGRGELTFSSSGIPIPGEGNLCSKAFYLLKNDFHDRMNDVHCAAHLHKMVPIGAGLGGGSSDAAFTLTMLNDIYKLNLNTVQLEAYAARLGSDCPFFIKNKAVFASGRGEIFESISLDLSPFFIKLVIPAIHVSTPWAYSQIKPKQPAFDLRRLGEIPVEDWKNTVVNDFEAPVFAKHPELPAIKEELYNEGALYASMSGSGSAVFGIFSAMPKHSSNREGSIVWTGKLG